MPSRARLDEFIAFVEAGDHAGAIERYYTEDATMQENAAPPRVSVLEGDRVAINWNFELTEKSGKVRRFDEIAWQEWRGDRIFCERFFYDPTKISS
jgi:hypothetical protein